MDVEARDHVLAESSSLIARLRKQRGWSLRELGQRAGVHRNQLSTFERTKVMPKADALYRVCAALDLPPHLVAKILLGQLTAAQAEAALATSQDAGDPAPHPATAPGVSPAKVFVIQLQSGAKQRVAAASMSGSGRGDLVLHDDQTTAVATEGTGVWKECWEQARILERTIAQPEGSSRRNRPRVVEHTMGRGVGAVGEGRSCGR